jgi:hypothetical protein
MAPGGRPRLCHRHLVASEIDERNTRYLDRSDTFEDAKVESKSADGLEAVFSAGVKQQYFSSAPTTSAAI